mmetsp:Transcript_21830/g.50284  ORF Transcript_21830/g.50284 Transcript_21830/m.50284 type:complete len:245 (+) Transcript_21830:74-808(+)
MFRFNVIVALSVVASFNAGGRVDASDSMTCGSGVELCGLLTLESGFGSGNYDHDECVVHGLWPEVSPYGTSECIAPSSSSADPEVVYSCYNQRNETTADCLSFEQHEWTSHGICAGVTDAADFFTQVCDLATAPLAVMQASRDAGGDLSAMSTALTAAGYEVFSTDTSNSQLELSACATSSGKWVLSPVADFGSVCGGSDSTDDSSASCVADTHGPACTSDADCTSVTDCVRCAGSGYCTDVPL